MLDLNDVADVVADAVREATAPLLKRIADLEARELVLPEKGMAGERGEKGEQGPAGKDADMDMVKQWVAEGIATAMEAMPAPEKGEAGERGEAGPEGKKGADGVDGKDGVGLADALIDKGGNLIVTMTDGRTKSLGLVNGRDGRDGADGEAFTIDDLAIEQVDERKLKFSFAKGEILKSFEVAFPVTIYRGVWAERSYAKGDLVTWAGSLWHANENTSDKPGTGAWQLAAKKGRDGRDAK